MYYTTSNKQLYEQLLDKHMLAFLTHEWKMGGLHSGWQVSLSLNSMLKT